MLFDADSIYQDLTAKAKINRQRNKIHVESLGNAEVAFYDYATFRVLFKEVFIEKHYQFESTQSAPVIIDCGANIGLTTLYFKQHFPHATIKAFEANPFAYTLLQRNIRLNQLAGVEAFNVALYDQETSIPFFIGSDIGTPTGSLTNWGQQKAITVKTARLSMYLQQLERVDLIKIDVEGAEINIINDLRVTGLLSKPDRYLIEYHHFKNKPAELGAFLRAFEEVGFAYAIKQINQYTYMQTLVLDFFKTDHH